MLEDGCIDAVRELAQRQGRPLSDVVRSKRPWTADVLRSGPAGQQPPQRRDEGQRLVDHHVV
ncbi:MAG: hypothetical protein ACLGII_02565, partial [Gammaproteobacteria bacterium]